MQSTTYDANAGDQAPPKPNRAQRREARRVQAQQVMVQELAATSRPRIGKSGGPQEGPATGQQAGQGETRTKQEIRKERAVKGRLPGRPSDFTEEEGDRICAWVAGGSSLTSYCKANNRAVDTVYRWMRGNAQFQATFMQAHEDRADTLTDEMLEIADEAAVSATIEDVAAAKLRVEVRKWIASKLRPARWGDKQTVEHVGAVNIRIGNTPLPGPAPLVQRVDRQQVIDA